MDLSEPSHFQRIRAKIMQCQQFVEVNPVLNSEFTVSKVEYLSIKTGLKKFTIKTLTHNVLSVTVMRVKNI